MFINRKVELATLDALYKSKNSEFVVIYGRRRVGKTELIKQFIKDKLGVYYLSDKTDLNNQCENIAKQIYEVTRDDLYLLAKDWYSLASLIQKEKKRMILAIDEFPYLIEADKSITSIFQKIWDEYLSKSNIVLILSGSSMSIMENETLGYKSPLYGRRTTQMLIEPMRFESAKLFFPNLSYDNFLSFYSILGGMPAYLIKFNENAKLINNIKDEILNNQKYLHREIEFILNQEFRSPSLYMQLLLVIASGANKLSEICSRLDLKSNQVFPYLQTMEQLHILKKEIPVGEDRNNSKKGLYKIRDNFFNFWFRYVYPYKSDLEIQKFENILSNINDNLINILSQNYENLCLDYVKHKYYNFEVGRWWNKDMEIDVLGMDDKNSVLVIGEVKYSTKKVGIEIYNNLVSKSSKFNYREKIYYIFSKSGFTKEVLEIKDENLVLVNGFDFLSKE